MYPSFVYWLLVAVGALARTFDQTSTPILLERAQTNTPTPNFACFPDNLYIEIVLNLKAYDDLVSFSRSNKHLYSQLQPLLHITRISDFTVRGAFLNMEMPSLSNSSTPEFSSLPDNVLMEIISNVKNYDDLISFGRSNKNVHSLIQPLLNIKRNCAFMTRDQIWPELMLLPSPLMGSVSCSNYIKEQIGIYYSKVSIVAFLLENNQTGYSVWDTLEWISAIPRDVEIGLSLTDYNSTHLKLITEGFIERITELTLSYCSFDVAFSSIISKFISDPKSRLRNLKILYSNPDPNLNTIFDNFENSKIIQFTLHCYYDVLEPKIDGVSFSNGLQKSSIKGLDIAGCDFDSLIWQRSLPKNLEDLSITIHGNLENNSTILENIFHSGRTPLLNLKLSGFVSFTYSGLVKFKQALSAPAPFKLKSLSLEDCDDISLYDILAVSLSNMSLSSLNIIHAKSSNEMWNFLCESFKYVQEVTLKQLIFQNWSLQGCLVDSKIKQLNIFNGIFSSEIFLISLSEQLKSSQLKALNFIDNNRMTSNAVNALISSDVNVFNETISMDMRYQALSRSSVFSKFYNYFQLLLHST